MLKNQLQSKQRELAISAMKKLGLKEEAIEAFKEKKLYLSRVGSCFLLDENYPDYEEIKNEIDKIEEHGHGLVYHVVYTNGLYGKIYSLLMISDYQEDWMMGEELVENKTAIAFCYNQTDPFISESGAIKVGNLNGSLVRVDM